jgi:hypothetical protein
MAQQGSISFHDVTWYLKYRIPELKDGSFQRVHKTRRLYMANGQEHHPLCRAGGASASGQEWQDHRTQALPGKLIQAINVNEPNTGRVRQGHSGR